MCAEFLDILLVDTGLPKHPLLVILRKLVERLQIEGGERLRSRRQQLILQ